MNGEWELNNYTPEEGSGPIADGGGEYAFGLWGGRLLAQLEERENWERQEDDPESIRAELTAYLRDLKRQRREEWGLQTDENWVEEPPCPEEYLEESAPDRPLLEMEIAQPGVKVELGTNEEIPQQPVSEQSGEQGGKRWVPRGDLNSAASWLEVVIERRKKQESLTRQISMNGPIPISGLQTQIIEKRERSIPHIGVPTWKQVAVLGGKVLNRAVGIIKAFYDLYSGEQGVVTTEASSPKGVTTSQESRQLKYHADKDGKPTRLDIPEFMQTRYQYVENIPTYSSQAVRQPAANKENIPGFMQGKYRDIDEW